MKKHDNVDEYLAEFTGETRKKLDSVRQTIIDITPEAKETIAYGIPTFKLNGRNLIHFGGYPRHISLYPTSAPVKEFEKELSSYKTSKGTIQFPIDKPLPLPLIKKIVKFCVQHNQARGKR